jgi:hypothetical protein
LRDPRYVIVMGSGQVSVWVPIVVAVLGILGIIGGQMFASWRDDRRWSQEIAREEARAQREIKTAELAREHEITLRWIDQRLTAYTECLSVFEEWLDILKQELIRLRSADGDDELGRRNAACNTAVKLSVDRVHLIGSDDAIRACLSAYGKFHHYHHRVNIADEPGWMPDEPAILREKFENEIVSAFRSLRDCLRRDLGVEPTHIQIKELMESAENGLLRAVHYMQVRLTAAEMIEA